MGMTPWSSASKTLEGCVSYLGGGVEGLQTVSGAISCARFARWFSTYL
jgi:hypothetical protein